MKLCPRCKVLKEDERFSYRADRNARRGICAKCAELTRTLHPCIGCGKLGRHKRCKQCAGHLRKGIPIHDEKTKKKMSISKLDELNPNWRGDKVGYTAIHNWVKRRKLKPKECDSCGQEKRLDLANISQEYKRDLNDWEWLCRRCHMLKDGRLNNFREYAKNRKARQKMVSL